MIGDNPLGDIAGANRANWRSILVQSGVYKPEDRESLSGDQIPTYEVADMKEAIELIIDVENLKV